jgi:hypothetical protein
MMSSLFKISLLDTTKKNRTKEFYDGPTAGQTIIFRKKEDGQELFLSRV